MAKKSPAFQFYPRDFLVDTQAMTAEAVGVYIRLLSFAWVGVEGAPQAHLVDDQETLRLLANVSPEQWQRVSAAVMKKFTKPGGGLIAQKRMLEIRDEQEAAAERRAQAARRRWDGSKDEPEPPKPKRSAPIQTPAPPPKLEEPVGADIDGFQRFIAVYPNPGNEMQAMRAWHGSGPAAPPAVRRPPDDELLSKLEAQIAAKETSGDPGWRAYFPHAKNWLANAGWNDRIVKARPKGSRKLDPSIVAGSHGADYSGGFFGEKT